jgi:hypothetical protein
MIRHGGMEHHVKMEDVPNVMLPYPTSSVIPQSDCRRETINRFCLVYSIAHRNTKYGFIKLKIDIMPHLLVHRCQEI